MDEIRIDRLTLQLAGLTEPQGRHLAMRITEGLAAADIPVDAAGWEGPIRVDLTAAAVSGSDPVDALSERVVAEVLRQIRGRL
jgi:hypothetical protein